MNEAKKIDDPGGYDLAAYLDGTAEERLRIIYDARRTSTDKHQQGFYEGMMLALTADMDQHPGWFDYGCVCAECLQYGD